jgi:chromosome transmission fidelity protein 1
VLVVGMPYPDRRDPLLRLKLAFADGLAAGAGRRVYEAMCMKAVNQSVGRAIRHANDYASIVLLDARYAQPHTLAQLPAWINASASAPPSASPSAGTTDTGFSDALASLQRFYAQFSE